MDLSGRKRDRRALLAVGAGVVLAARASAREPRQSRGATLWLIGDSTVNNGTRGQMGWGTPLSEMADTAKLSVVNRARGGRSSRTFFTEELWRKVADELVPGDFVLIQFGHNDGGGLSDPRGRASIKGNGDETAEAKNASGALETVHSYGWYLREYCRASKTKGAIPIVVSPVPRNIWKDGKVGRSGGDYGKWAKEAALFSGAAFLDLNAAVADTYDELGAERVAPLFFGDHTHTSPEGARLTARRVAGELERLRASGALPKFPEKAFTPEKTVPREIGAKQIGAKEKAVGK